MRAILLEFAIVACCAMVAIREFARRRDTATDEATRKKYAMFVVLGWVVIGGNLAMSCSTYMRNYGPQQNNQQQNKASGLPLENVIRDGLRQEQENEQP